MKLGIMSVSAIPEVVSALKNPSKKRRKKRLQHADFAHVFAWVNEVEPALDSSGDITV
jgi:hypothetical protein